MLTFEIGYFREGVLVSDEERAPTITSALAAWLERTAVSTIHVVYIRRKESGVHSAF